ncbi:hypothetical protein H6F77_08500 [Microcoleus sp. FACHB-831]|uniref:DUF6232 family protein n=1 Tax=Microcoleus sp. FACHB-831 TaxID=2692827 RepID=UPI001683A157|nr:DUF6232 family protein [Microcoleus sp. FACHB-831]MBD1921130.1 hypothetical protein [Microcoleus sp. FACHB-831]
MSEVAFYDNGIVKVTRTLFEVPGTQYPIRNIGAVKTSIETPSRTGPLICLVIGVILLVAYVGILVIALAILWSISQKPTYWIVVVSAGTESRAFSSRDPNQIREIQSAINAALSQH